MAFTVAVIRASAPLTVLLSVILLNPVAAQQPTPAQRDAIRSSCRSDFMANCSGVQPGGKDALDCLKRNLAKLSGGCQAAVSAISPAPAPATVAAPAPPPAPAASAPAAPVASAPVAPAGSKPLAARPAPAPEDGGPAPGRSAAGSASRSRSGAGRTDDTAARLAADVAAAAHDDHGDLPG